MAILTSKGARAPHQLKGRRNVRISRDRRGCGNDDIERLKNEFNNALMNFYTEMGVNRLREKRVGEIYNSNGYWKVKMTGFYARPIVIKCIGTLGLYDIAMFGKECSANLIRLGKPSTQVTYKYKNPSENEQMGYLFIKSNVMNVSHTIFTVDTFNGGLVGTLEESTAEEYNNATDF